MGITISNLVEFDDEVSSIDSSFDTFYHLNDIDDTDMDSMKISESNRVRQLKEFLTTLQILYERCQKYNGHEFANFVPIPSLDVQNSTISHVFVNEFHRHFSQKTFIDLTAKTDMYLQYHPHANEVVELRNHLAKFQYL